MKLVCQIELPDTADYKTILDAMAQASRDESKWTKVFSRDSNMKQTNLENKCGTCKYFELKSLKYSKCKGDCMKGRAEYRRRTCKACTLYERKQEE